MRSLRKGGITEYANNGQLSVFDACARSGHSTGTTVDSYIDKNNTLHGIRAARSRVGYQNLDGKDFLPRLDALGSENQESIESLIKELYLVNIQEFRIMGTLRPVLRMLKLANY